MASTWADAINWEMEHGTFDLANLREFMKGLVDGGPTRSGHRFPTVIVTMPVLGYSEAYMYANSWVVAQVLSTGANGLCGCPISLRFPGCSEIIHGRDAWLG